MRFARFRAGVLRFCRALAIATFKTTLRVPRVQFKQRTLIITEPQTSAYLNSEVSSMNILCITHADFETPGIIAQWALDAGHDFRVEKPYRGERLSDASEFDMLIVMGGPQSPMKQAEFPYLTSEISLIKSAVVLNKKMLGFCLGAQLIGEALGARTTRSPEKEVGVYPIELTVAGSSDPLLKGLPDEFPVIHWHNDMPGLIDSSVVLAASRGCPRQIVRYKVNIYGFQCHMEITSEGVSTMVDAAPGDLLPSKFTRSRRELLSTDHSSINRMMTTILNRFAAL
jgi:GMP synthase (glutamine-hydrolysing)